MQIGCNSGKLWKRYDENGLKCDPKVVIEFPVDKAVKQFASPWGGLIIFQVRDRKETHQHATIILHFCSQVPANQDYGTVTLTIDNAVESPKFTYSKANNVKKDYYGITNANLLIF